MSPFFCSSWRDKAWWWKIRSKLAIICHHSPSLHLSRSGFANWRLSSRNEHTFPPLQLSLSRFHSPILPSLQKSRSVYKLLGYQRSFIPNSLFTAGRLRSRPVIRPSIVSHPIGGSAQVGSRTHSQVPAPYLSSLPHHSRGTILFPPHTSSVYLAKRSITSGIRICSGVWINVGMPHSEGFTFFVSVYCQ